MCLCLCLCLFLCLVAPGRAETARGCVGQLKTHVAVEGEDLLSISRRFRLAIDHVAFANGFPVTTLRVRPGTRLIIPTWRILPANPPVNGIVVNLPERGFYLFQGGKFRNFYPISIGDEAAEGGRFSTRTGQFTIIEKIKNPTWYPPSWARDRTPVGPGPKNPLGERWIGLSLPRTGIHGTNDPLNVGNSLTHGCMRMYPELLTEVYDAVSVGWPVRIEYETAKVGKTLDGQIVAVTFPDVYRRQDPVKTLRQTLARLGVGPPGRRNFDDVAALALGFPVEVARKEPVEQEVARRLGWPEEEP